MLACERPDPLSSPLLPCEPRGTKGKEARLNRMWEGDHTCQRERERKEKEKKSKEVLFARRSLSPLYTEANVAALKWETSVYVVIVLLFEQPFHPSSNPGLCGQGMGDSCSCRFRCFAWSATCVDSPLFGDFLECCLVLVFIFFLSGEKKACGRLRIMRWANCSARTSSSALRAMKYLKPALPRWELENVRITDILQKKKPVSKYAGCFCQPFRERTVDNLLLHNLPTYI